MSQTTRRRAAGLLLLLLAALLPAAGQAQPGIEGTRIAGQAGWSWAPNSGFVKSAAEAGTPLRRAPSGAPTLLGVFGYQVYSSMEIAIELGVGIEPLSFSGLPSSRVATVPLVVATRWFPASSGKLSPYLGTGGGYYLNFFSGGIGSFESHTAGFFAAAGALWQVGERVSLVGELRYALATAGFPGIGGLNVGGLSLSLGAQFSFPPERDELR